MKMRGKIYLFSTVWLVLAMVVITVAIYYLFESRLTEREEAQAALETERIAEALAEAGGAVPTAQLLRAYLPAEGMIRIIEGENDSSPLVITKDRSTASLPPLYKTGQSTTLRELDGRRFITATFPAMLNDGRLVTLEVTENVEDTYALLDILRLVLFIAALVVLIPSILAGKTLGDLIVKPLITMTKTMEDIQKQGDFQRIKLDKTSDDELSQLAATFNRMMDILEENYEKQEQFVSDASHELKTPLTAIESYANLLKRWGAKKPEVLEESIEAIVSESQRMKGMTEQMLELANHGTERLERQGVILNELVQETVQTMRQAYQRTIIWTDDLEKVVVYADKEKTKQVLYILLDNALKYSDEAVEVRLLMMKSKAGFP
ncbi:sensor histidine kinase [Litoribacterium kuwaitense]|uniref:sensor histidine kinase n=1 Tax=Litoribacterium kuwaitense TaxID=1398745 RepID=UPI001FEAFFB0|nr:HAMP domain-containing sensor histidine kinase [Litoribacterium kuwaitense]